MVETSFFNKTALDRMTNKVKILHDTVEAKYEFNRPLTLSGLFTATDVKGSRV